MSIHLAKPEHQVVYQELVELVAKHAGEMGAEEVLAVAANMVGKLIALQDQRMYTVEQVMKVVEENIKRGNIEVQDQLMQSKGIA